MWTPYRLAGPRAWIARGFFFFGLWIVLTGIDLGDVLIGLPVGALAAWVSLRLLPATTRRHDPVAAAGLVLRFVGHSVSAGLDVARRAFDPRLPLRTGLLTYEARCPPGLFRSVFTAYTSLQPGTLPAGSDGGGIVYHCLDVDAPVLSQLAAAEAALSRVNRDG